MIGKRFIVAFCCLAAITFNSVQAAEKPNIIVHPGR